MKYQLFLEIHNKFGFYLCLIPHRLRQTQNGKFISETIRFQKITCITIHFIILYWWIMQIYNGFEQVWMERKSYPGNVLPYFLTMFNTCLVTSKYVLLYQYVFRTKHLLRYVNDLSKFSTKQHGTIKIRNSKFWNTITITFALGLHTLYVINIVFIRPNYDITLNNTLNRVRKELLPGRLGNILATNDPTFGNYLVSILSLIFYIIKNLQGSYWALCFSTSISGLVLISMEFKKLTQGKQINVQNTLTTYKRICRLTRYHNKFYRFAFMLFLLSFLFSCSLSVVSNNGTFLTRSFGYVTFRVMWIVLYLLVILPGIIFVRNMATIGNILETGIPLDLRSQSMLLHLKNVKLCKIRAHVMPVSFTMVDKFVGFIMMILMVTITPSCN